MLDKARLKEADILLKQSSELLKTSIKQATATRNVMAKMLTDLADLQRQRPENPGLIDALAKLSRIQRQNAEIETHLIQLAQINADQLLGQSTIEELEELDLDNL